MLTFLQSKDDAGLLREYTAQRYGATLAFGGYAETFRIASRMVARVARLAAITEAEARAAIVGDYLVSEA